MTTMEVDVDFLRTIERVAIYILAGRSGLAAQCHRANH
jgi:hypothetical protein